MYYKNYEDYMRAVLGYPIERQNTYSNYSNNYLQANNTNLVTQYMQAENSYTIANNKRYNENDFLNFYPEIYKIVNPMVCKICENNNKPITKELIQKMTDEVYNNLEETEITTVVNVNASFNNSSSKIDSKTNKIENNIQNRNVKNTQNMQNSKPNSLSTKSDTTSKTKDTENIGVRETRQLKPRNNLLRDLIQILILKKLLEENKLPTRPPKPPVNPIPPRPPIRPRDYVDYYKF